MEPLRSHLLTLANALVWALVARAFTRRPALAAVAGTLVSAGLMAGVLAASGPIDLVGLAGQHAPALAVLVAAAVAADRLAARWPRLAWPARPAAHHWIGRSTWLGALLALALLVGTWFSLVAAGVTAPLVHHPRAVSAALVAGWVAGGLSVAWWVVGAWRSARRSAALGGGWRAAAWLGRLGVVAVILLAAVVGVSDSDEIADHAAVAFGPSEREQYVTRLLRGGSELELAGRLGFGVGEDLEAALDEHPEVQVLHLDSGGGRVFEGGRIAELVEARGLITYVAGACESACVIAFSAGRERWLGPTAVIGLHQSTAAGMTDRQRRQGAREEADALVARGVDRAFAERGAATPPGEMWRPSHEEVLSARLATGHAAPSQVALSGLSPEAIERLHLTLRENPLHEALFEFERPLFERTSEALKDGYRRGLSEPEAIPFLDDEVARLLDQDLPRTSDQAARDYFLAVAAAGRALERQGAQICLAFLDDRDSALAATGPARLRQLMEAVARVIRDARNEPSPVPSLGAVAGALLRAQEEAEAAHPETDDLEAAAARTRPAEHCDAQLDLFEAMARAEPAVSGPVIRYLASVSDDEEEEEEEDAAAGGATSGAAGR